MGHDNAALRLQVYAIRKRRSSLKIGDLLRSSIVFQASTVYSILGRVELSASESAAISVAVTVFAIYYLNTIQDSFLDIELGSFANVGKLGR